MLLNTFLFYFPPNNIIMNSDIQQKVKYLIYTFTSKCVRKKEKDYKLYVRIPNIIVLRILRYYSIKYYKIIFIHRL